MKKKLYFIQIVLSAIFFTLHASAQNRAQALNNRSDTIDIINYTLNLDITDSANTQIKGSTIIKFAAKINGVTQLDLDLLKLLIDSITLNNIQIPYNYNDTLLRIHMQNALNIIDTANVTVYYHGVPQGDPSGFGGFYFSGGYYYNIGVGFAANPHVYGRVWHPCFDNFVERATYDFNIITKLNNKAICNGALMGQTNNGNGTQTWTWKLTETIPSYLASVAVSAYTTVYQTYNGINGTIPIELTSNPVDTTNFKISFTHLPNALSLFESRFGPYRWNKVGFVSVPFNGGAMEHATCISYPRVTIDGTLTYETLFAHELSHHWFGNLATCETQEDMWLNEGWAKYCEHLFTESVYGKSLFISAVKTNLISVLRYTHLKEGGYRAVSGIPHQYTYGDHVYKKGAVVAHSLRGYMNDTTFFNGITYYLNNHQHKKTNSNEFKNDMSTYSGINLTDFFNDWVYSPGFPHFSVDSFNVVPNGNNFDVTVFVKQKLKGAPHLYNNVPLELTFMDAAWTKQTRIINVSGANSSATFTLNTNPIYCGSNTNQRLNDAISSLDKVIKTTGAHNLTNAFMNIVVNAVPDSVYLRIEHNWVAPDSIKMYGKPYQLSTERYWKVDGIIPPSFKAAGKIAYDGRTSVNYTYGLLDNGLINVNEDSLLLLFRKNAGDDWIIFPKYTKTMGNTADKTGSISIDSLVVGEYALANKNYTHSAQNKPIIGSNIIIYPNPGDENITVKCDNKHDTILEITLIDTLGKIIVIEYKNGNNSTCVLNTKQVKNGTYTIVVKTTNSTISKKTIITH